MQHIDLATVTCKIREDACMELSVPGRSAKYVIPPAPAAAYTTNVPARVAPALEALGFPAATADTILSLISLPENSTPRWWKNYDYIEALHDGRGYTATLFGACSGTGDLLMILQALQRIEPDHPLTEFVPALKKARGDDIKGLKGMEKAIKGLGSDPAWRQAVWEVYVKLYWSFAAAFADKTGDCSKRPGPKMTTPLTRGFMVDVALNHGGNMPSFDPILKRMMNPNQGDELSWFYDFVEARRAMLKRGVDDLDTSRTGHRCTLWANIAREGNLTLARPIEVFPGYWGACTLR